MPRVLIVEDEVLIADVIADVLTEHGYEVCGMARGVAEAIELGEALEPDLAIIDLHLADGGNGVEVGRRLRRQGALGVLYTTGGSIDGVLTSDDGEGSLSKPFELASLVEALRIVERMVQARQAAPTPPPGFEVLAPPAGRTLPVIAEAVPSLNSLRSALDLAERAGVEKDRLLSENRLVLIERNRLIEDAKILALEMHHRVRNNLQLVHAMLHQQQRLIGDEAMKEDIGVIARRVMTQAKIHDHLLGVGLSRTVEVGGYLRSLCEGFEELESVRGREIGLVYDFEPLELDLDIVTVIGLVTAELISNSYRHAFPTGKGTIRLSLKSSALAGEATLTVCDDGIGFASGGKGHRHGLGLVGRLMEQIRGSATVRSDLGAAWVLKFPLSHAFQQTAGPGPDSASTRFRRPAAPEAPGHAGATGRRRFASVSGPASP